MRVEAGLLGQTETAALVAAVRIRLGQLLAAQGHLVRAMTEVVGLQPAAAALAVVVVVLLILVVMVGYLQTVVMVVMAQYP